MGALTRPPPPLPLPALRPSQPRTHCPRASCRPGAPPAPPACRRRGGAGTPCRRICVGTKRSAVGASPGPAMGPRPSRAEGSPAAPRPTLWAQLPFTSRSSAAALRPPGCNWPTAPPRVSSARGRRGAVRASPAPQCAPVRGGTRPHPPRLPKGTGGKASRGGGADLQHRQLPRVVPIPLEGHGGPQRCSAVAMGSARRPLPGPPSRRTSRGRGDQWGARRRGAARHDGSCSSPSHFRSRTRRPRDYDSQRPPRRARAGPGSSGAPRYGGGSGAPSGARGHFAGTGAALRSDGERREGRRAEPTAGTAPSQPRPHRVPCRPWSCAVPIPSPSPSLSYPIPVPILSLSLCHPVPYPSRSVPSPLPSQCFSHPCPYSIPYPTPPPPSLSHRWSRSNAPTASTHRTPFS